MEIKVIRSKRKSITLSVKGQTVLVRAPLKTSEEEIKSILKKHTRWIARRLAEQAQNAEKASLCGTLTADELDRLTAEAKRVIPARVAYYAPLIGVNCGCITIRRQKTRWGSYSSNGNLSFNCLLMLLPPEVVDSVVVHELCHRKHMDHSGAFYQEVYRVFPTYDACHDVLKREGAVVLERMKGNAD